MMLKIWRDTMTTIFKKPRQLIRIIRGSDTQDGAGVQLTRFIPSHSLPLLDPFLLLDSFRSNNPQDYIAGFPPHPHRGFETVTYLLAGRVRHRDSAGHSGVVEAGGVQWMTAGRGIEHSEMPEQEQGLLEGFQLWVNLPAAQKMATPCYQEFAPQEIPLEPHENGTRIRVIAGQTACGTRGAVNGISVQPLYLDIALPAGETYQERLASGHNAFIYLISGSLTIAGDKTQNNRIEPRQLGVLSDGDSVVIEANQASRLLLLAGRPIGEPVVRHGPFVMNSTEQIEQAYRDYQAGLFGRLDETPDAVA
ncbi:pirin [endosymbiont of Riftia pachyptila (vent Ph05)]|uniref:Pirin n=2 Tax=endosymbiont of Riftia pachyptila TaxID=54396 RepID=G2DHN8_9GAMM|nr:pirin [endosymbiont of Riftia pachyptila (vent Ph05)]